MSRSVFVTGGNRGIGLAVARAFQDAGDRVAATYRSGPAPAGLLGLRCDVTDAAAVDDAFSRAEREHGPVEVLVSNAGITRDQLILRMAEEDFTDVVNTNLAGAYRVARRATRSMLRTRRGRIVFISSVAALHGAAGQANYAASKAGLLGLARSLARELGSRNITVNVVAPGLTETDMTSALPDERRAAILSRIPLARAATPEQIASVVTFLASPAAGYITGAAIPADGGLAMGH